MIKGMNKVVLIGAVLTALIGCEGSSEDDNSQANVQEPSPATLVEKVSLYNNANDALVYEVETYLGTYSYYGDKSSEDMSIDGVIYPDGSGNEIAIFDDAGFTTITHDGLVVRFNEEMFIVSDAETDETYTFRASELNQAIASPAIANASGFFGKESEKLRVKLQQCGQPIQDEIVWAKYGGKHDGVTVQEQITPLVHVGGGVYESNLPFSYASISQDVLDSKFNDYLIKGEKKCDELSAFTEDVLQLIVKEINDALVADAGFNKKLEEAGVDTSKIAGFSSTKRYAVFLKFMDKINAVSDTVNFFSSSTEEKVNILTGLLASRELLYCFVGDDLKDAGEYQEFLFEKYLNEYVLDESFPVSVELKKRNLAQTFTVTDGDQSFDMDIESKPSITEFSAPQKVQQYSAYQITMGTECIDDEYATVSVKGTDDYQYTDVTYLSAGSNSYGYTIPGGGAGVQDTIEGKLHDSSGNVLQQERLLLFFED
ncbi:hypothetical protein [Vibrio owensii]|uniref:hypothetical protein n=1 Tax=Vibrio owensii TaxID=696485 RepID=UPI0018F1BE95|nr:hypothetical protein [Vibrio owensii]